MFSFTFKNFKTLEEEKKEIRIIDQQRKNYDPFFFAKVFNLKNQPLNFFVPHATRIVQQSESKNNFTKDSNRKRLQKLNFKLFLSFA